MHTYIYSNSSIFMHRCIYTYTHICTHTSIFIHRRMDKHRTRKYINSSIHIWTSRTPNQSPASVSATRQRHINSRQNNVRLSTLQIKENSAQTQAQGMTLISTHPIHLYVYLPLIFLLFMYALTHSWGVDATVGI